MKEVRPAMMAAFAQQAWEPGRPMASRRGQARLSLIELLLLATLAAMLLVTTIGRVLDP